MNKTKLENAYCWGFEDATAGVDQRGSQFFLILSAYWHAYNEGYTDGTAVLSTITTITAAATQNFF